MLSIVYLSTLFTGNFDGGVTAICLTAAISLSLSFIVIVLSLTPTGIVKCSLEVHDRGTGDRDIGVIV